MFNFYFTFTVLYVLDATVWSEIQHHLNNSEQQFINYGTNVTEAQWETASLSHPGPAFALSVLLHLLPSPQTSFNPNKFLKSCVCGFVFFFLYIRTDYVCACLREYSHLLARFFDLCRIWEALGDSEMSFKGVWSQNLHIHYSIWSCMYHNSFLPMTISS